MLENVFFFLNLNILEYRRREKRRLNHQINFNRVATAEVWSHGGDLSERWSSLMHYRMHEGVSVGI